MQASSKYRSRLKRCANKQGWPAPYICTLYDRIFGDFPAKITVHTPHVCMVLATPTNKGLIADHSSSAM
jgi:hypothetical protein